MLWQDNNPRARLQPSHSARESVGESLQRQPKLLIVDDDTFIVRALSVIAQRAGYDAQGVNRVADIDRQALSVVRVILIDLVMPDQDGIEAIRLLADCGYDGYVIVQSGASVRVREMAVAAARAYGLNVVASLGKPFVGEEVEALLKGLVHTDDAIAIASDTGFSLDDLAQALREDQLYMVYQPQFRVVDGAWCGVEALLRWQHPSLGSVSPAAFFEEIEHSALLPEFTDFVIGRSLQDYAKLRRLTGWSGTLSVNVSPAALLDKSFSDRLLNALQVNGIEAEALLIELTETTVFVNLPATRDIIARLSLRGVRFSLDDFGTGNAGINRVRSGVFSELKIDRSFIQGGPEDVQSRALVNYAIELAHALDAVVVAEGVNDLATLEYLRERRCDIVQGFLLGRPMSLDDLIPWAHELLAARDDTTRAEPAERA